MQIRCENPSDYQAVAEVNIEAFGRENEARLVEQVRHSDRYIPQLSLVAELNGNIVGHILLSYIDLVGEASFQVLGLAPLAVRSRFQRQGIGSALVNAGLARAEAMKEVMVIVLGDPRFYCRFGFESSTLYEITSPFPVPEAAFRVKLLQHYQEGHKGKVVYPVAFQKV